MPTAEEFESSIEIIDNYIPKIGDDLNVRFSEVMDDELIVEDDSDSSNDVKEINFYQRLNISVESPAELEGFYCQHGNFEYVIWSHDQREYFTIVFPVDVISEMASVLSDEQAMKILEVDKLPDDDNDDDEGAPPEYKLDAAEEFLDSIDEDHMRQLDFYLGERLTSPLVAFHILSGIRNDQYESDYIEAFTVTKKIYPQDDDFSLTYFSDAVQAVVSVGVGGLRYLSNAFIFDIMQEESTISEIDIHS